MIAWCATVIYLVCQLMPAGTQQIRLEREVQEVIVSREPDGGWRMVEAGKCLARFYVEGEIIRCVPSEENELLGAGEFTVNIGEKLAVNPGIDWATVTRVETLADEYGTPIVIERMADRIQFIQRSGPLRDGVYMLMP